ncbi:MAG: hypothetical protein K0V04_38305 [Deltaproteobacteria bacterium]|nr:hypothetical protein [Deltaproteobacteria bacterium]
MSTPDDELNWHRDKYPCAAGMTLIRFVEDRGYELDIGDEEGEAHGWAGGSGEEGRPIPEALMTEPWQPRAPSADEPVGSRIVTDRWIYAVKRSDGLDFHYEIRADGDGRIRWIDAAYYHDLRGDGDIEDLDDAAYLERWSAGGGEVSSGFAAPGTDFTPPVTTCHESIPWYFFAIPVRLPKEAVDALLASGDLFGPSAGFVHGTRPLVDSPDYHASTVSVVEAPVIDPLVEVRRCTESYFRRQDRYIEYLDPLEGSQRAELVQARKLTLRIANAAVAITDNSEEFSADDVLAPAEPSWEEVKEMCFTDEELEIIGPDLLHPGNGALNFVAAEAKVRNTLRREASQTATALRIWLASRSWAFVEEWIVKRSSHNPEAAWWLSLALSEATGRLHELPTGARYISWLVNRAIEPDYHDDPNVDIVRMFAFPEIDTASGLEDFRLYAKLPRAALSLYLLGQRWLLSRRAETIAGYLQLAFGDNAKVFNPTIAAAMDKYAMSSKRRIFYRGMDRFEDGLRRIAGRPLLDCVALPTQKKVIVYSNSGDFGTPVALGTTLRVSTADDLADDLLKWEAEHADWGDSDSRWFTKKFSKLKVPHVGFVLSTFDLFVNARELRIALDDDDKVTYDHAKAATMVFSSIFSVYDAGKAAMLADEVADPVVKAMQAKASKMPVVGAEDFRSVRAIFGKMAGKVSASAVALVLSVIAVGFAAHDASVAYDEKTQEEYYAAVGGLIASALGVASTIVSLLVVGRAGLWVGLIALAVGLAVLAYTFWLPDDAEIAVRTSLFGVEYQRRRAESDYDHSARPWQACFQNSPRWFVPSLRTPPVEGLVTQVLALTNLMSNYTVALGTLKQGDQRGLKIALRPGFVSRDSRFEFEVEMTWFLNGGFHLDTWSTTYRFSMFPEPWSIPVDHGLRDGWEQDDRLHGLDDSERAELRRVFHSTVLASGGPIEIVRPDPAGCTLELTPHNGAWSTHEGELQAHVDKINLHETYRTEAQVVGAGPGRRLRVTVIQERAPGWSATIYSAETRYSVDQDGPVAKQAEIWPSASPDGATFDVPLPQDDGDLIPGTFRMRLVYEVKLPGDDVKVYGSPSSLGAAHDAWPTGAEGRALEIRVPFESRISHDGRGLVVELAHGVVTCMELSSGKGMTHVDLPMRGVLMQYVRNEDREPPQYYDGYQPGAGRWLEPAGDGRFGLASSHSPGGAEPEQVRRGDRLRYRFVFELGEADEGAQLYPCDDIGPEAVPHGHGGAADDAAAAERLTLASAKVKVRLVSDETDAVTAMPSNSEDDRIVWLEVDFSPPPGEVWVEGEPAQGEPPAPPKTAISACLPPSIGLVE